MALNRVPCSFSCCITAQLWTSLVVHLQKRYVQDVRLRSLQLKPGLKSYARSQVSWLNTCAYRALEILNTTPEHDLDMAFGWERYPQYQSLSVASPSSKWKRRTPCEWALVYCASLRVSERNAIHTICVSCGQVLWSRATLFYSDRLGIFASQSYFDIATRADCPDQGSSEQFQPVDSGRFWSKVMLDVMFSNLRRKKTLRKEQHKQWQRPALRRSRFARQHRSMR